MRIVLIFVIIVFFVVLWRLFTVQIVSGAKYRNKVDNQYASRKTNQVADRGNIFFVDKDGIRSTAAGQDIQYQLAVDPRRVIDQKETYNALVRTAPEVITVETWDSAIMQTQRITVPLGLIPETTATRIKQVKIPGIQVIEERIRSYPGGSRAAHVIGFLAYREDLFGGQYGLEKSYEQQLQGSNTSLYRNFFADIFSDINALMRDESVRVGSGNLITTIEPEIQGHVETTLDELYQKWNPAEAGIIVMNPRTGAILAMGARPTFDINSFQKAESASVYTNPLIQRVYEMGSIMKPLIMGFAFEKGVVSPDTKYNDQGNIVVGDRTIWNFDKKSRGVVDMQEVLIQSLNTGMVFIMNKLDRGEMYDYLHSLGFGEKTGIDLPYESTGILRNLESRRAVEYANVSFGQGVAMTPLAMMRALSAIANDGRMVTPYIVDHVEYQFGPDLIPERGLPVQVLDPNAAHEVARIMTKLVDVNFGNRSFASPHYSVAAKTGTAQIASPNGGYYEDRKLHSFFGFFPSYNPRFSIFIYMVNPTGARYSAETLADPFLETTQFLVNYYNIPPDREID